MRKVIEHGFLWQQEHFPKYTKCHDCNCVFTFEQEDVRYKSGLKSFSVCQYVNCPECYSICSDDESEWKFFEEE